jgi:hypothetical protein
MPRHTTIPTTEFYLVVPLYSELGKYITEQQNSPLKSIPRATHSGLSIELFY